MPVEGVEQRPECEFYDAYTKSCTAKQIRRFESYEPDCSNCDMFHKSARTIERENTTQIKRDIVRGLSFLAAGAIVIDAAYFTYDSFKKNSGSSNHERD